MNVTEFVFAVDRTLRDVRFDTNIIVSTFETNIRMLGGLLGAHSMMLDFSLRQRRNLLTLGGGAREMLRTYQTGLLDLALDLVGPARSGFSSPPSILRAVAN